MEDRPTRPEVEFDLEEGDEYRIFTRRAGNLLYRHVPREPSWWRAAEDARRRTALEHFDPDDVFTLVLEIASFVAVDKPDEGDVARLFRNHWALSWMVEVAALADDPFTQDHVILRQSVGGHRLLTVAQFGAHAGRNLLLRLPRVLAVWGERQAESCRYDVVELDGSDAA